MLTIALNTWVLQKWKNVITIIPRSFWTVVSLELFIIRIINAWATKKRIPAQSKDWAWTVNECKNSKDTRKLLLSVFYLDFGIISIQLCRVERLTTIFFLNVTEMEQNGPDGELTYCWLRSIEDNLPSLSLSQKKWKSNCSLKSLGLLWGLCNLEMCKRLQNLCDSSVQLRQHYEDFFYI